MTMRQVTVISKPNCMQCAMTKRALTAQGTLYLDLDLTRDDDLMEWVLAHDFQQAPIVVVGDMETDDFISWTGFQPDEIAKLAGEAGWSAIPIKP